MATGFTHAVSETDDYSFRDFALKFGNMERGKPPTPNDPEEDAEWYRQSLKKSRADLKEALSWTAEEADQRAEQSYQECVKLSYESQLHREQVQSRYETMIAKVKAWNPRNRNLNKTKKFMIEQLEQSIEHDCRDYDWSVVRESGPAYQAHMIQSAKDQIKYTSNQIRRSLKRTRRQNELSALFYETVMASED